MYIIIDSGIVELKKSQTSYNDIEKESQKPKYCFHFNYLN